MVKKRVVTVVTMVTTLSPEKNQYFPRICQPVTVTQVTKKLSSISDPKYVFFLFSRLSKARMNH
jgi:hypothetical protein